MMAAILSVLLLVGVPPVESGSGDRAEEQADFDEEVEEEVDFDEEEVDFGDEEPVVRVRLPDVEYRSWLLGLPIALMALLGWNVAWRRRSSRKRLPRSAAPD